MTNSEPLISVLICNYNYGRYIEESLDSVLKQNYKNLEIIIVDDGSSDDSVSKIENIRLQPPKVSIELKAKKTNEGLCYARNDAIEMANGEYFVFLDSDDTMPSDYISTMYATAVQHNADVTYGDVCYFGDKEGRLDAPSYDPEKLILDNYINISALVRKSAVGTHRFDIKLNRKSHEDYDFWLGLSLAGLTFVKAEDAYINYRIQQESRNSNTSNLTNRLLGFIDAWTYMVKKYGEQYEIDKNIAFTQMRAKIAQITADLDNLNNVVQDQLNPELKKRENHINQQQKTLDAYKERSEALEAILQQVVESRDYRVGQKFMGGVRKLKKVARLKRRP